MNKKKKGLIIGGVLLVAFIVSGCIFLPGLLGKKVSHAENERQINTVTLEKMDLTESVSATGTIEAASSDMVSADVQNVTVKDVLVSVGDTVTKGQKLVSFDKSELKEALAEAKEDYSDTVFQTSSELSQAYQQLSEARSTYYSEKKKLEKKVKEAKAALKKAKKAAKSGKSSKNATTPDTLSDTSSTINTNMSSGTMSVSEAEAALEQAKENLESTNKQNQKSITQAQQQVTQAQTNNKKQLRQGKRSVQDAKKTLESASMTATMDGTVTALGVSDGDSYNGGDAVQISDLSSLQVTTTISEYDINKVEKGQRVVILTDATGDEEIEGEITYVALTMGDTTLSDSQSQSGSDISSGMSGSSSSSSGSGYEVIITLKNANEKLRSGMTAKCSIITKEVSDVLAVPYDAIHTNSDNKDVIYVKDSSGNRSEVEITKGMESDYYVEVSGEGLSEGMSVIIPSDEVSTDSSKSDDSSDSGFGFMMGGGDMPGGGFHGDGGNGGPPSGGFSGASN